MKLLRVIIGMAIVCTLAGCTSEGPSSSGGSTETATTSKSNSSHSATPNADTLPKADPADYSTLLGSLINASPTSIQGVDFDSTDRNITCSVFDPYNPENASSSAPEPWAGCTVFHASAFNFPQEDGGIALTNSVSVSGTGSARYFVLADLVFPGGYPQTADKIKTLQPGYSITWSTVTCSNLNDTISCNNAASGHGFTLTTSSVSTH